MDLTVSIGKHESHSLPQGYTMFKASAQIGGEEIGYLKTEHVTKEDQEEYYPTIWHFHAMNRAGSLKAAAETNNREKMWDEVMVGPTCPEDPEKRERDLERWKDNNMHHYEEWKEAVVDSPFISYVFIERGHRREGIGTALYLGMAKWLERNHGYHLHSSTIRSADAESIWSYFKKQGYPVHEKKAYRDKTRMYFDFGLS